MPSKNTRPTIQRIVELQQLIADFARVERTKQLADTGRLENDVEHSYSLALTCWFLAPKIAPHLDMTKIFSYALAHDTVELHAGDTFIFDEAGIATKSDREDQAIEKLQEDWPDFSEVAEAAKNYKAKADEEAKFVYAVDKILPVIMVNLGEKASFWKRHKVTRQMLIDQKRGPMHVSNEVAPYFDALVEWMSNPDYFYSEPSQQG
jgi:putative hydrolase of HD superfamily